ncbi:hypothetical protein ABZ918_10490 [Streptomyces viridosporus]|uniref:hypothetical protein n=1 Tax=Streptomyces viridosporus TaxID=67581 RepID=UPI003432FF45
MKVADLMADCLAQHARRRVAFDALASAAEAGDSSLAASPQRRRILADAAQLLRTRNLAVLPAGSDGWDYSTHPPLPRWVQRPPAARSPRPKPGPRAWVELLSFARTQRLSAADHLLLDPINALLRDEPDAEIIPLAERSYQLYGDEKYLKDIERHHLVRKGLLDVTTHLRAKPTPAPLAMYELGPARWLLIVENIAAFASLREVLRAWPDRRQVGWLALGSGDQLIASIPTAIDAFRERDHPVDDVLMYADLDLKGLRCAQQAGRHAQAAGLPSLRPAAGLYQALLARPPRRVAPVSQDEAHAATAWLPPGLAARVTQLLADGIVLRQEALCRPRLSGLLSPHVPLLPQLRDGLAAPDAPAQQAHAASAVRPEPGKALPDASPPCRPGP